MAWSLYSGDKFLEPLKFSNGKTQEDVVNEVLDLIKKEKKVIFIKGICGTGKSAIALHLAKEMGKTSIIVPGKNLQAQYKSDYEKDKYLLKSNKEKLKINIITGRNNHKCKFLEDNKNAIPRIKREINSKLLDIFEGKRKEIEDTINNDISADNQFIPCKIELKEKNWRKIKEYIKQNNKIKEKNISDIKDVKRATIASVCPYWSPVLPEKYELKYFKDSDKKYYEGLGKNKFVFCKGKPGCSFYEQFNSYINSDAIVFNSLKYKLESALGRKPHTEVEIVDECDEFLDSFSNQKTINIDRLQNSLAYIFGKDIRLEELLKELNELIKKLRFNNKSRDEEEILLLKETKVYDILKLILDSEKIFEDVDEENYIFDVYNTAKIFEDFMDETYVIFNKKENNLIVNLVTINLAKKFKEMLDNNEVIVLMSGTLHSQKVIEDIFGIKNFEIIEAEIEKQGQIELHLTGLEMDCKYSNFSNGKNSRENYLKALDKCAKVAKKPVLVHIISFFDLPTEEEIKKFGIKNLISREELIENQKIDKTGEDVKSFKEGNIELLFSTKCSRGIDFPNEQCNSIIFTKYPNPNIKEPFWRILEKTDKEKYWEFYKDKARRELWQKVYRGLRSKDDHVYILSPDKRVLGFFKPFC